MAVTFMSLAAPAWGKDEIDPAIKSISTGRLEDRSSQQAPLPQGARKQARTYQAGEPAEGGEQVGLMQAVRLAVDWHPSIGQAIGTLYQQGEQVNVAEAGYYPQISGGVKSGYDNAYGGYRSSQAFSLSLKQMLYDFGKVSSSVDVARARVARSQASILLNIDQVARDTSYAYLEVQRYKQLMDIAQAQIKGVGAIVDLARQRSDMGASTRSDVVQAESRVEGARAQLLLYKAQYQRWQATLTNLAGRSTPFAVNDDFPQALTQSCEGAQPDMNALPAILVAEAERVEAQAQVAQARAEGRPTLSVGPTLTHYLDDNYNQYSPELERTQVGVFLNFEVPIYQGGAINARTAAAGHALTAADSAEDAARLQAREGLFEAQAQTASLNQRLGSLEYRQKSITEARALYGSQYLELGTRPLLDLLNAEQEIHQSRFDLANTIADLRRLQIDCLYSTGSLRSAYQIDHSTIQGVEILP